MKLNVDQGIVDLDHSPIRFAANPAATPEDLTLRRVCIVALTEYAPEEKPTGEQKFRCGQLAAAIAEGGVVPLKIDQLAKIRDRIGKIWSTMVTYRAWQMIDAAGDDPARTGDTHVAPHRPSPAAALDPADETP